MFSSAANKPEPVLCPTRYGVRRTRENAIIRALYNKMLSEERSHQLSVEASPERRGVAREAL